MTEAVFFTDDGKLVCLTTGVVFFTEAGERTCLTMEAACRNHSENISDII